VGIKAAVNLKGQKSALGVYHAPTHVLIDPSVLATLPSVHLIQGLAEIVKMAMVRDAGLLDLLVEHAPQLRRASFWAEDEVADHIIWHAVQGMLAELEPNLYEDQTYERLVDFGHTFSPIIEARSGYRVHHGEAVAVDMAYSCAIAVELGLLGENICQNLLRLFIHLGLPCESDLLDLGEAGLQAAVRHRGGKPNLVVPIGWGKATFVRDMQRLSRPVLRQARLRLARMTTAAPSIKQGAMLVFDVGGTSLRAALFDPRTRSLIKRMRLDTPSIETQPNASFATLYCQLMHAIERAAEELCGRIAPAQVGIAFPGPLDGRGRVSAAPTVWGDLQTEHIDIRIALQQQWPEAKILVLNDVAAAGYCYADQQDFCVITVSSGIGHKIFIDGKPRVGVRGRGGEMGHMRVDFSPDAPVCDCGGVGHLAAHASGRGTLRYARDHATRLPAEFRASVLYDLTDWDADQLTNEMLATAYADGDAWARSRVHEKARFLAYAIAQQHQNLGLERFVIYGGFARALGEPYRAFLAKEAAAASWQADCDWDRWLTLGDHDDDAGLLGMGLALTDQ
jgi:glucokinase